MLEVVLSLSKSGAVAPLAVPVADVKAAFPARQRSAVVGALALLKIHGDIGRAPSGRVRVIGGLAKLLGALAKSPHASEVTVETWESQVKREAVWHEHHSSLACTDEVHGRFDAIEDATGAIYVLDVGANVVIRPCVTREEATTAAKEAAAAYAGPKASW